MARAEYRADLYRYCTIAHGATEQIARYCASKRIGVTNLTFRGYMTSSITWPIAHRLPVFLIGGAGVLEFGTNQAVKHRSLTDSEIFNVEYSNVTQWLTW